MPRVPVTHPAYGLMLNHNAIRADLPRLEQCVRGTSVLDRDAAGLLTQWFGFIARALHHHHEAEDEDIYTLLAERDPTFKAAVAPLIDEHEKLTALVTSVETTLAALRDASSDAERATHSSALVEHVSALNKVLIAHLDREEMEILDRMAAHLTQKDMRRIENKMRRRAPLKDVALVLPWIYDTASEEDRAVFMKMIPWMFKVLMRYRWQPSYAKISAPLAAFRAGR